MSVGVGDGVADCARDGVGVNVGVICDSHIPPSAVGTHRNPQRMYEKMEQYGDRVGVLVGDGTCVGPKGRQLVKSPEQREGFPQWMMLQFVPD